MIHFTEDCAANEPGRPTEARHSWGQLNNGGAMITAAGKSTRVRIACWGMFASMAFIISLPIAAAVQPALLVISQDMELDPAQTYGAIVIRGSHLTLDGRGATLVGSKSDDPRSFTGTAIYADGATHVTLRNLRARGFETGLHVVNGRSWHIHDCDFSDNFHDPSFGWGENGRRGGILCEHVDHSLIERCRANRVWDGCCLVSSHFNRLQANDFSHTSNTCLKLWNACDNEVVDNDLSYGLRKEPDEVHARDSACVLIESGSDRNHFVGNDCRHGGDGIFIRVLNQWVSSHNRFERNDCSFANNNCIEAWSPANTWIGNKANRGSYGFWLGASDRNVLLDNEANENGRPDGNHQSPHLPDGSFAGIVFMFGPSSHTLVRGNTCRGNQGAGIAAIGDLETNGKKWNAFHWIIEENHLEQNRWGIFLQHAEMIDLCGNHFDRNGRDVFTTGQVTDLHDHGAAIPSLRAPVAVLRGPRVVNVDADVQFDATASSDPQGKALSYRWRCQPEGQSTTAVWTRRFAEPGFYRLALTVNNGHQSDLAFRDVYAVRNVSELGTEASSDGWSWDDPQSSVRFESSADDALVGRQSLHVTVAPYRGQRIGLRYELRGDRPKLQPASRLSFWLKSRNENLPAWQDANPLITLVGGDQRQVVLTPRQDLLGNPPYLEARDGWTYFTIPIAGDATWQRTGDLVHDVASIQLGFDSWGAPDLQFWIDGLSID